DRRVRSDSARRRDRGGKPCGAARPRQKDGAGKGALRTTGTNRRGDRRIGRRGKFRRRRDTVRARMNGTTPEGARNEQEAARWVRGMFDTIAPRYDLANHLLSVNIDRYWRARTVKRVRPALERPGARVLDICCGTGDLSLALAKHANVLGSDFS